MGSLTLLARDLIALAKKEGSTGMGGQVFSSKASQLRAIISEKVGRLQQSIALLPKNCLEQVAPNPNPNPNPSPDPSPSPSPNPNPNPNPNPIPSPRPNPTFEQSPGSTSSDAPITRAPSLRDFSLLRCLGTGGFAEVWP